MPGTLSAQNGYGLILNKVNGKNETIHGQDIWEDLFEAGRIMSELSLHRFHHSWRE